MSTAQRCPGSGLPPAKRGGGQWGCQHCSLELVQGIITPPPGHVPEVPAPEHAPKEWAPVECTVLPVVQVAIKGERREGESSLHIRHDNGIIVAFLKWCADEGIAFTRSTAGGGMFVGYFKPEDSERVKAWLLENGCEEREPDDG
jgi:hypothetical protein